MRRAYGRKVNHDERSRRYGLVVNPRVELTSRDWPTAGPIIDQGDVGMCVGASLAHLLNVCRTRDGGSQFLGHAEALDLYEDATKIDPFDGEYPPDDTGTDAVSVCKVAQEHGLVRVYNHAFGLRQTLLALQTGPVMAGFTWHEGMEEPDADGRISATGEVLGGHQVVLSGIDTRAETVTVLNSWSADWGRGGRAFLSWEDLRLLLADEGDITIPQPGGTP
ncbi:cysteine protease [Gordonia phage Lilbeanie]|uniref:Cysteine protease n=1 Tax=Gordonia phage Lilbeanie TaxID=2794947 RepID=A0A7T1KSD2_9CAUD|nr:peptidase [Gordonia phage Lilbeanie]QPO17118.1 cysteine protease [Gordonia phage Lilbeanie]